MQEIRPSRGAVAVTVRQKQKHITDSSAMDYHWENVLPFHVSFRSAEFIVCNVFIALNLRMAIEWIVPCDLARHACTPVARATAMKTD